MPGAVEAITLTELGFNVFPLEPRGKRPLTPNGCKDATRDNDVIHTWWTRWPDANIGVATGPGSNLYVIDIDGPDAETAWSSLAQTGDDDTLTVNTSRGRHLYYRCGDPLPNTASRIAVGIDTRGNGGYVVAPPSIHPSGATYEFAAARLPRDIPQWIRDLVTPRANNTGGDPTMVLGHPARDAYAKATLSRLYDSVAKAEEGTRNDTLNRAAFSAGNLIAGGVLEEHDVEMTLHAAASAAGLTTNEAQATIHSGVTSGMQHPWTPDLRAPHTTPPQPPAATTTAPENTPHAEERPSSWQPVDIATAADTPPPDPAFHHQVIYPDGRHLISGEPEAMKSWFALTAIRPALDAGGTALVINTDGTPTWDIAQRLQALGHTDQELRHRIAVVNPTDPPTKEDVQHLVDRGDTLIILDALDPAGHLIGADTNTSEGIQIVMRTLVDPFAGRCVLIIDHVAKDKESRGRYAIGSQRKLAAVDVHIGLELTGGQPLTREGGEATTTITIHKDRFGGISRGPKGRYGTITWTATPGGQEITHAVTDTHATTTRGSDWRPTVLMGRVADALTIDGSAMTKNQIADATRGKRAEVLKAVQYLYADGYLTLEFGPNNAELYRLSKPYEEG